MKQLHIGVLALVWLLVGWTSATAQDTVAYYTFNGNAKDVSGYGNDAQVRGAQLTQDRFGFANRAFVFDGEQSALVAPNADQLNSNYATVSFWIRVDELPGQGEVYLLSLGGWQERWKVSLPSHGKLIWTTNGVNGISDMDAGDGNELVVGEWTHVALVHNGIHDQIFINGMLANEKVVQGALNTTTRELGIGYNPIDGGNYFAGALDEVMIFDGGLSAAQVLALYQLQNTPILVLPGIVAEYRFNNSTRDFSAYANQGRPMNVSPATDRFGYGRSAYDFNGENSKIVVANSTQLNSEYTTVSFWVRVDELPAPGSEAYLLSHGGWQERWKISLPNHGKLVWTTNASSISDMDSGDGNALVEGEWTHVVMVHDGTQDKIFFDGVLAASKNVSGPLNDTQHPLGIGFNPIDNANYFNGVLDEIIIYNVPFTNQQVADLYAQQSNPPQPPSDLVANYTFAGHTDDVSQYGNDAAADGGAFTTDRFGYANNAYQFDGMTEMTAPNSVALNSDYASASFWIRVDELPAQGEAFLLSNGGWQERWKISLPGHGKPVWTTNTTVNITDMDSGDGHALTVGEWAHVVTVREEMHNIIYINGQMVNSRDVEGTLKDTDYPLGIGFNPIDGGNYFTGALDDIQIYSRALSAAEVLALFESQDMAPTFADTLVANYPLNGSGRDLTPFNNNASVNGALSGTDRFDRANHAFCFDGQDDYLQAENSPQLNSDYTSVSFWVKVNALPGQGEYYLLSHGGWQERWKISLPNHGKPVWTTNSDVISDMDSGDGNTLAVGEWTHVVMVHNGTQDKIFFDGQLVASKNVSGPLNDTQHPLGIGYNPIDNANFFDGCLDDVQIYNVALSDQAVAALYAAQAAEPPSDDTSAPTAPLNLTAEVEFNNVNLSWDASTDDNAVVAYNVYQDMVLIATTDSTSYWAANLLQLTTFTFGVTAVDAAGNESTMTTVNATTGEEATPDTTPPSVPGNLTADAGSNSVILSWEASTDDRQVAGYVVLVDGVVFDTVAATTTSILVTGLESETPYTFEVYAFDAAGNNSGFAEITISTEPELDTGEPGLVAWYPFEGNANDATPYNNHGVIGGNPTFQTVTDRPLAGGQAIVFDGMQDSVLAPNAVQLISDFTTVSFWIRVDGQNFNDAEAYVLDFGHWDQRWKISLPQHLKIVWTTNSKNDMFDNFISDMDSGDGNELSLGFWWHVTMVHDGTDDIIYVDGQEVNRKAVTGTLNSTGRPLGMGNNPIEGGQYFQGALDELKIYNRALTAEEIARLYATGTTPVHEPDALADKAVVVYPNPSVDRVLIQHQFDGKEPLLIRVFDSQGRQIDARRFTGGELLNGQLELDIAGYPVGQYQLNFVLGTSSLGSRAIVKH